jgi:hypothetical protein
LHSHDRGEVHHQNLLRSATPQHHHDAAFRQLVAPVAALPPSQERRLIENTGAERSSSVISMHAD